MLLSHYFRIAAPLLLQLFLMLVTQPQATQTLPDIIRIGGLFDHGDLRQELAFQYAVDSVNSAKSMFSRTRSRLEPVIERIPAYDSFHASKRVCHLLRSGVAAIFGPQSGQTSAHVQSICDALEVPHVETRWDYRLRRDDYSVNLYPHPSSLSKAYLDLVRLFGWTSFCILYEDNDGLIRLQELLKTPSPQKFKISIRQLGRGNDYRDVLRGIKNEGETNILLDCKTEKIVEVLKQGQQIGMMTAYTNYIITSLDTHLLDLEDFKYGGSNITALRLLAPVMNELAAATSRKINRVQGNQPTMGTETALVYDAVHLFVKAIKALDNSTDVQMAPLMCDGRDAWIHGNSLINYMKLENMTGLTGEIKFDSLGFRTNFDLDIVELNRQGFQKVGTWNRQSGANYTRTSQEVHDEAVLGLKNKTLIVSFAFNDPYIMRKKSAVHLSGNNRFEGFCVSLLDEISEILGFNYTLVPVKGNVYGSKDPVTKKFNGMIKELLDKRADMAITDLTINYEREEAVDFTMPFMNLGISILYKKPQKMAPSLFSFLSPLSVEVWMYMITAYCGVSMILYILARFTPYEWQNPHPCNPEPDSLENQFTMLNCMWFAIGSLMQQGCDFLPQAVSTRMVAGMWWFFTLIMISSYTANLAAFLTVERMESPIESAEDLAKQNKIKYGAYESGSTAAFFRDSKLETYQTMWNYMNTTHNVFAADNNAGFQRVQDDNGLYAFLSESTSIEYQTERKCDLTQVGGLLDSKSYGIALPPGSAYKDSLDVAILRLQESGTLFINKEKWWKEMHGGGRCTEEAGGSSMASELNLSNVGGVFVVLIGGMGLALVVAIFEFLGECKEISKEDDIPFMIVLRQELQFVFKCKGSTKPVRKKASETGDDVEDVDDDDREETIYIGSDVYGYGTKHPIS